jgi:hypothetical protein
MKTFLKALILVPLALLVVLLAIANRGPVRLSLDPCSRSCPTSCRSTSCSSGP